MTQTCARWPREGKRRLRKLYPAGAFGRHSPKPHLLVDGATSNEGRSLPSGAYPVRTRGLARTRHESDAQRNGNLGELAGHTAAVSFLLAFAAVILSMTSLTLKLAALARGGNSLKESIHLA